ncbi:MAG: hypothetical protein ACKVUT_06945 [Gaiella sp.]
MNRLCLLIVCAALAAAGATGIAAADGGPSPGVVSGWDGVRAQGAPIRYVTASAGRWTTLQVIRVRDGRVVRYTQLAGGFGIPLVAYDGTTGGLSADLRTLVLGTWVTRSASSTQFAVFETRRLRLERRIVLRGRFAFDAIAPDGRIMYVTEYLGEDGLRYRVRRVDLRTGRLLPGAIVDRSEGTAVMRGQPVTRAESRAGWAFTLYASPDGHHFVHALDTVRARAFCIDLPWHGLQSEAAWRLRFALDERAGVLRLRRPGQGIVARIDLRTLRIAASAEPEP